MPELPEWSRIRLIRFVILELKYTLILREKVLSGQLDKSQAQQTLIFTKAKKFNSKEFI